MYSSHRDWISIWRFCLHSALGITRARRILALPLLVNGRGELHRPAQVRLHAAASEDAHDEGAGLRLSSSAQLGRTRGELLRQLWLPRRALPPHRHPAHRLLCPGPGSLSTQESTGRWHRRCWAFHARRWMGANLSCKGCA